MTEDDFWFLTKRAAGAAAENENGDEPMIDDIKKAMAARDFWDELDTLKWLSALVEYYEAAEQAGFINPSDRLELARKKLKGE